jgi:hypothetical protein
MAPFARAIPFANTREHGVRSLSVACHLCHRQAVTNVDGFGGHPSRCPAFCPRMVCTSCGIVGADARPNWQEREGGRA